MSVNALVARCATSLLCAGLVLGGLLFPLRSAKAFEDEVSVITILGLYLFGGGKDPVTVGKAKALGAEARHTNYIVGPVIPLTDNLKIGLSGGQGRTKSSWRQFGNTEVRSDMVAASGMLEWKPYEDITFVFAATVGKFDNHLTGFGTSALFDSRMWNVNATVFRKFDMGAYYIQPSVGLSYGRAKSDAFVDSVFQQVTAATDLGFTRVVAGAELGIEFMCRYKPVEKSRPIYTKAPVKAPLARRDRCGNLYVRLNGVHDNISGYIDRDPTVPDPTTSSLGILATVGATVPLWENVTAAAWVSAFDVGDVSGWIAQGYIAIDLWAMAGREPLFGH